MTLPAAADSSSRLATATSQTKRLKTVSHEISCPIEGNDNRCEPRLQGISMEDESESLVCGICFSEGGKSISGQIDSCDHYFCFVCIMEWAKVESRCPMCKQRFAVIRRPPKLGVFASERIINVPHRDQVYKISGNVTNTSSDPYVETCCMSCQNMADEDLMLLCDLCDSAAHTYCVGLGYNVPEGDWFCHDCAFLRAEHQKIDETEVSIESKGVDIAQECNGSSLNNSDISVFDIVKDEDGSSLAHKDLIRIHRMVTPCQIVESSARTLQRCRNVQSHIQVLRDNWSSFRDGSLRFSSDSGQSSGKKRKEGSSSFISSLNKQSRAKDLEQEKRDPYDTNKAWKMMAMAKTVQKQRTSNGGNGNGLLPKPRYLCPIRSSFHLSKKPQESCRMKMKQKETVFRHETDQNLEKQKLLVGQNLLQTRSSAMPTHINCSQEIHTRNQSSRSVHTVQLSEEDYSLSRTKIDLPSSSSAKTMDDAKTEVQSLVKLSLKLLTKGKPLGVKLFKEIARISTHTILAACGLEHSKSRIRSFLTPKCNHDDHQSSSLMRELCSECFKALTSNVVGSILDEQK